MWVLLPIYGGYTALTDGVGKAWVADHLPPDRLGSGLGYFQGVTGGCALIAGLWAGLLWNGDGRLPLLISGATTAALCLALALHGFVGRTARAGPVSRR